MDYTYYIHYNSAIYMQLNIKFGNVHAHMYMDVYVVCTFATPTLRYSSYGYLAQILCGTPSN